MDPEINKLKNKLSAVRNMIALANVDLSVVESDKLGNQFLKIQNELLGQLIETEPEYLPGSFAMLRDELIEWMNLKKMLSDQSYNERRLASDNIIRLGNEIVDKASYDADSYFETYFLTNKLGSLLDMSKIFTDTFVFSLDTFVRWFSDSVCATDKGVPIKYFHGTKSRHERFDFSLFPGMYFAQNKAYSEYFAGPEGTIMDVYLKVTNPLDLTLFGINKVRYEEFVAYLELKYGYNLKPIKALQVFSDRESGLFAWQYLRNGTDWLNQIKDDGLYDGIIFEENNPALETSKKGYQTPAVMVFSPEQIKTTQGNLTYSSYSKDIRFDEGGEVPYHLKGDEINLMGWFVNLPIEEQVKITNYKLGDDPFGEQNYEYTTVNLENEFYRMSDADKNKAYYSRVKMKSGGSISSNKIDFYETYYKNLTPEPYEVNKNLNSIEIVGFDRMDEAKLESQAMKLFGLNYALLTSEQKENIKSSMMKSHIELNDLTLDEMSDESFIKTLNKTK